MERMKQERFCLIIPLSDAFAFAMGWSDLGYGKASDGMRQLVGLLVIDALEYNEHWRESGRARKSLAKRWPKLFMKQIPQ
jgi:hypothetical protein